MEIKQYKKENDYSYSLGAFPTIELLDNHPNSIIKVLIHSTFKNEEVISKIKQYGDKIIAYNDKLIDKLSSKENVYVIGIFKKYNQVLSKDKNHLILVNPSNMGNFGTIVRSALGFGFNNIAIIRPGIDYFDPKTIRSSMGAIFKSNICYFNSFEEYKKQYNHKCYSFMLQATTSLDSVRFTNELSSLVFGNEATGLDNSYLDNNSIVIKHSNDIDSLNLQTAVSIALYEFNRQIK